MSEARDHQLMIAARNWARAQRTQATARPGSDAQRFTNLQRDTFVRLLKLTPAQQIAQLLLALADGEEAA